MIDGIRQNLSYLEPGARKGAKADGAKPAPSVSAGSSSMGAIGAEVVEISASGQAAGGPAVAPCLCHRPAEIHFSLGQCFG